MPMNIPLLSVQPGRVYQAWMSYLQKPTRVAQKQIPDFHLGVPADLVLRIYNDARLQDAVEQSFLTMRNDPDTLPPILLAMKSKATVVSEANAGETAWQLIQAHQVNVPRLWLSLSLEKLSTEQIIILEQHSSQRLISKSYATQQAWSLVRQVLLRKISSTM